MQSCLDTRRLRLGWPARTLCLASSRSARRRTVATTLSSPLASLSALSTSAERLRFSSCLQAHADEGGYFGKYFSIGCVLEEPSSVRCVGVRRLVRF